MSYYSLINQFAKFATGGKPSSFYLNKSRLLEKAQNNTNLTDFGEYNFDEALQILLNSLNQEARLNALGITKFKITNGSLQWNKTNFYPSRSAENNSFCI